MNNSAKIALVTGDRWQPRPGTRDRRSAGTARRKCSTDLQNASCRGERGGYTG